MKTSLFTHLATLGPIGYFYIPGTMATAATLALVIGLKMFGLSFTQEVLVVTGIAVACWFVISGALAKLNRFDDPQEIVLDEMVGCLITFVGIPTLWWTLLLGFGLFRLFDVTKCFGIGRLELLSGATGILADDVVAGILANIVLYSTWYILT